MRLLFVMGGAAAPTLHAREQLLLPGEDGARQIAQKGVGAFAWAAAHVAFKYVLNDDDSFVARLVERLHYAPRRGFYLGDATDPSYRVESTYVRCSAAPYTGRRLRPRRHGGARPPRFRATRRSRTRWWVPARGLATLVNVPSAIRHKNRGEFAVTVCEVDTGVLVHNLSIDELRRCRLAAPAQRRCAACVCATGQTLAKRTLVRTFGPPGAAERRPD